MKRILKFLKGEPFRIVTGLSLFIPAFFLEHLGVAVTPVILYILSLLVAGTPVFYDAVRGIIRLDFLDEKFLMSIASVGAMVIGEMGEGCAVMLFFLVGEYFEHKAVAKSRKSIKALMDICPDEARVITDDTEEMQDCEDVEIGSLILIRPGERVPIDILVISGSTDIDVSHLSGESVPISVSVGSEIQSGSIVLDGVIKGKTLRSVEDSSASRILQLVEEANERKSKTESFITRFSRIYTPTVVILALLVAVIPPIFDLLLWSESVYRALMFLVISCPCALVISVPMSFFAGIGGSAAKGILFKGSNVFSSLAKADTFVFDKTGTLTDGKFVVSAVNTVGISENELLYYAASAEFMSNHPIARCLSLASDNHTEPKELSEIAGKGIIATVEGRRVAVGNSALMIDEGVAESDISDYKGIFVSIDGIYRGSIEISDSIKCEAADAIKALRKRGAKRITMLSGDRRDKAEYVGNTLGFDEVRAELSPKEKYDKLEEIIAASYKTVYVGDGINDAPSIARSDIGIAMGTVGSDSAIENADIVITSDNLARIPDAVKAARKTVGIATQNIVFAIGVKVAVLILGALGITNMWVAVFADVGVAVIAILNAMRALKQK